MGVRYGHSAASIKNHIVVTGGILDGGAYPNSVLRFDPQANKWWNVTTVGALQGAVGQATAAFGDKMWLFGGEDSIGAARTNVTQLDFTLADTRTVTVQSLTPLAAARSDAAAAVLSSSAGGSTFVLIFGGPAQRSAFDRTGDL